MIKLFWKLFGLTKNFRGKIVYAWQLERFAIKAYYQIKFANEKCIRNTKHSPWGVELKEAWNLSSLLIHPLQIIRKRNQDQILALKKIKISFTQRDLGSM